MFFSSSQFWLLKRNYEEFSKVRKAGMQIVCDFPRVHLLRRSD